MIHTRPAIVLSCAACLAFAVAPLRVDVSTRAIETAGAFAATAAKPAAKTATPAKSAAKAAPAKAKKVTKAKGKKSRKAAKSKSRGKGKPTAVAALPLDRLEAAQVEPDMVKNAGSKSAIELLASYKQAVNEGDLETAAVLLRVTSGHKLTHEIVSQANELLGVTLDGDDREVLVQLSASPRTAEVANAVAPKTEAADVSTFEGRISSVHAVANAAPRTSALNCLVAYKRAVETGRSDTAGIALAAAIRKPVDEPTVHEANELLGLTSSQVNIPEVASSGRSAAVPVAPVAPVPVAPVPAAPIVVPAPQAEAVPSLVPLVPSALELAPAPAPLTPSMTDLLSPAPMYEPAVQEAEAAMAAASIVSDAVPMPVPAPKRQR